MTGIDMRLSDNAYKAKNVGIFCGTRDTETFPKRPIKAERETRWVMVLKAHKGDQLPIENRKI